MTRTLAEDAEGGKVFVCRNCNDVHVKWENWMFKLDAASFRRFSKMVQAAAGRKACGGGLPLPRSRAMGETWVN